MAYTFVCQWFILFPFLHYARQTDRHTSLAISLCSFLLVFALGMVCYWYCAKARARRHAEAATEDLQQSENSTEAGLHVSQYVECKSPGKSAKLHMSRRAQRRKTPMPFRALPYREDPSPSSDGLNSDAQHRPLQNKGSLLPILHSTPMLIADVSQSVEVITRDKSLCFCDFTVGRDGLTSEHTCTCLCNNSLKVTSV